MQASFVYSFPNSATYGTQYAAFHRLIFVGNIGCDAGAIGAYYGFPLGIKQGQMGGLTYL
jgi:hypothetical protein